MVSTDSLGIICVDDEGVVLESLKEQLRRNLTHIENLVIEVADTGEEALDIIEELQEEKIQVALIISDQIMPGMKGDELLVTVHQQYPKILKILLTGQANTDSVGNAVNQANLYRYITKPWEETDLCLTVTEALRRYQQDLRLEQQNLTLRDLNASLESKVEARTQELKSANELLKEAKEAAEVASTAKTAFLASMSHELRTPLNAILGFSQILSHDQSLGPTQHEQLSIINRSGEHLLNLINDVLEMSKIEAGKMTLNLDSLDLHGLLNDLHAMLSLKAEAKGLQLLLTTAPNLPDCIEADPSKLRQVLINLLGNAIKFTQTGTVTLAVEASPASPTAPPLPRASASPLTRLLFSVIDTGPGIAADELPQIFDAFIQTETGRTSQKGTGLGLSISSQLVQLMGGQLTVNSQVGQGTCFQFDMTAQLSQSCAPALHHQARVVGLAPDQPNYRILVVDDAPDLRLLMSEMLKAVGFEVREAANGAVAISTYQTWQPHAILMDWHMPVMDGETATRQIRRSANPPVIIAVSASVFDEKETDILNAGCQVLLHKPVTEQSLLNALAQHLGVRYLEDGTYPDATQLSNAEVALSPTETSHPPTLDTEILARSVDPSWLESLQMAASVLDSDSCLSLISQLSQDQAALASALTGLVNDFRFDLLMELTQPTNT